MGVHEEHKRQLFDSRFRKPNNFPHKCICQREQIDVPSPHVSEKVEVASLIPQERFQQRIVEEIAEILVPQILEHVVEVFDVSPQERVSERTVVQTAGEP